MPARFDGPAWLAQASNILVGRDGSVRLSDLGVAAKLERNFSCPAAEGFATLERRNTFVGSPAFIAPELLTGLEQGSVLAPRLGLVPDLCCIFQKMPQPLIQRAASKSAL